MNNKVKVTFFVGTFIILSFVGYFLMSKNNDEVIYYSNEKNEVSSILVYVVGEVESPGVFEIEEGMRLNEVIELAGGATDEADLERLNLAKILKDEEKINVPKKVELIELMQNENGPININTANVDMLMNLSGIGKSTAEKIINYRNENGYFDSIEDIMNVSRNR